MMQPYDAQGTDRNLQGFKTFGSYGDKFGDFSTYFSYNHLENEGQPMTPTTLTGLTAASATAKPLTGAITEQNPKGNGTGGAAGQPMLQIGSDGIYHSTDNLFKWKGLYDLNKDLNTSLLVAYQNLEVSHTGQSFMKDANGQTVWGSQLAGTGTGNSANGYKLSNSTAFGSSNQNRETFTLGWGLNGKIFGNWNTNTNVTYFNILKDSTLSSSYNSSDPITNTAAGLVGQKSSWKDSGWVSLSTKFDNQEFFGNKDLSFSAGYEYQHAKMLQTVTSLSNFAGGTIAATAANPQGINTKSGGTLDTHGLFGQLSWRFLPHWDATVGTRLERWNMSNGIYQTVANLTGSLNPQDRQVSAWSPKFSLGFEPRNWKFRYSIGRAYRFPVADELFGNSASVNGSVSLANSTLKPEEGTHHNLLGEYDFEDGYVRLNLFHENIRNAIYSQYIYLAPNAPLSSIVSSIGEVETNGLDISANRNRIMGYPVDVKVNSTILNTKIISNPLNPALVGNQMPLMPHYRVNFLTTYHYGNDLDLSVGTRYQSKMNSQPDNQDLQLPYYGAFTESVYVDLKATYRFNSEKGHVSAGIDNINGYQAFFNHPLPLRTFFAQVGYKF
jgi:iron complex outermembrane receptor protein